MIIVHHLADSRSQRVLWLLEELGLDYEVRRYERDPATMLAPAELKAIHPLGKSPVLDDGDVRVAETGAIIEYLLDTHAAGRLRPAAGSADRLRFTYWMHYAEGSAMPPLLLKLVFSQLPKRAPGLVKPIVNGIVKAANKSFIDPQLKTHADYWNSELGRPAEAEPLLHQVAEYRATLSDRHMEAISLAALADAMNGQGRHEEAEAAYGRAVGLLRAHYQPGFAMTLSGVLLGRAETRQAMGWTQAAEDDYRQAVEIARANVAPGHPRLTLRQLGLAAFLNDQRRPGEALALLRPARDALLARTRDLGGGEARAEVEPFRSLFRETVQAAWVATQP